MYLELSHEAIHLLSPTGYPDVTYLEEGLVNHFSLEHTTQEHPDYVIGFPPERHKEALELVSHVLKTDTDAIKKLRAREKLLVIITSDMLQEVCPFLTMLEADRFAARF